MIWTRLVLSSISHLYGWDRKVVKGEDEVRQWESHVETGYFLRVSTPIEKEVHFHPLIMRDFSICSSLMVVIIQELCLRLGRCVDIQRGDIAHVALQQRQIFLFFFSLPVSIIYPAGIWCIQINILWIMVIHSKPKPWGLSLLLCSSSPAHTCSALRLPLCCAPLSSSSNSF